LPVSDISDRDAVSIPQGTGVHPQSQLNEAHLPHFCSLPLLFPPLSSGPKISQNVNYTERGTMERLKTRARHGGAKRQSAEGVGSGQGRHSPSLVWGLGALPP